jgi:hypothetical protein
VGEAIRSGADLSGESVTPSSACYTFLYLNNGRVCHCNR